MYRNAIVARVVPVMKMKRYPFTLSSTVLYSRMTTRDVVAAPNKIPIDWQPQTIITLRGTEDGV